MKPINYISNDVVELRERIKVLEQELADAKAKLLSISINDLPEKDREHEELKQGRDQLQRQVEHMTSSIKTAKRFMIESLGYLLEQTDENRD